MATSEHEQDRAIKRTDLLKSDTTAVPTSSPLH